MVDDVLLPKQDQATAGALMHRMPEQNGYIL